MVVEATEPEEGVKVTELAKADPVLVETSKPVGGVTTKLALRLVPLTVNVCSVELEPEQAVKAERVPDVEIVGAETDTDALLL